VDRVYDLAIIGGGINGCGIARDAAGRGNSVFLCEMNDLASGTSSWSTKLVHGGLRYLEYYEFRLVREALIEREILWQIAPHIIRPLRFVLPHHSGLRPAWLLRLGLFLYDHIGGRHLLPPTRSVDLVHDEVGKPLIANRYTKGFEYSDCFVDDARLVVLTARDAADRGAEIHTRSRAVEIRQADGIWQVTVENVMSGERTTIRSRALVNAGEAVGNTVWGTLYVQALTGERAKIAELHRQLCRLLAAILLPASAIAAAAAPELVDLLLGPKWVDLAFLLRVLLPAWALTVIATQIGAILLAKGGFIIQFWCSAGQSMGRALVVFSAPWTGLAGTMFGIVGVSVLYSAAILYFSRAATGCALLPLLRGFVGPGISSVVAAAACLLTIDSFAASPAVTLSALAVGIISFLISMLIIDRRSLIEDWQAIRRLAAGPDKAAA